MHPPGRTSRRVLPTEEYDRKSMSPFAILLWPLLHYTLKWPPMHGTNTRDLCSTRLKLFSINHIHFICDRTTQVDASSLQFRLITSLSIQARLFVNRKSIHHGDTHCAWPEVVCRWRHIMPVISVERLISVASPSATFDASQDSFRCTKHEAKEWWHLYGTKAKLPHCIRQRLNP